MGNVSKPKLVIAGPGAAKILRMVDEIIHALKSLELSLYDSCYLYQFGNKKHKKTAR